VDPRFPGGEAEINGGVEIGIGQAHGGQAEFRRPGEDGTDGEKGIVEAVVGPDIERGVSGHSLLYKCIINVPEVRQAGFGLGEAGAWGKVNP